MSSILEIRLDKIAHNVNFLSNKIKSHNGELFGVTKVVCADEKVAETFINNGCTGLADSRWENLKKLKTSLFYIEALKNGKKIPLLNLRIPAITELPYIIEYSDISLVSEIETIAKIEKIASTMKKRYGIILMIDLGDLREGIIPENATKIDINLWEKEIDKFFNKLPELNYLYFYGIGTNLACYGGVAPSEENMGLIVHLKNYINKKYNINIKHISGVNSSGIPFFLNGKLPEEIDNFRLGESLLLGVNVLNREPIEGMVQDTFILKSEIIELKNKPSLPIGNRGQNAFGEIVEFEDKGIQKRAILSIGRQDVVVEGLKPIDNKIEVLGASSDHLEIDVSKSDKTYNLGDYIEFIPNYAALLALSTSNYVEKIYSE